MLNKLSLYIFTLLILLLISCKIKHLNLFVKNQDDQLQRIVFIYKYQKKYLDKMIDSYQYQIQLCEILINKYYIEFINKFSITTDSIEERTKEINNLLKEYELIQLLKKELANKENDFLVQIDNPLYKNGKRKKRLQDSLTDSDLIRAILDSHIRNDPYNWFLETYKNNLIVDNNIQKLENGLIKVTGTFNFLTIDETILTKTYTAVLNKNNNEFNVISCKWFSDENYLNSEKENDSDNDNELGEDFTVSSNKFHVELKKYSEPVYNHSLEFIKIDTCSCFEVKIRMLSYPNHESTLQPTNSNKCLNKTREVILPRKYKKKLIQYEFEFYCKQEKLHSQRSIFPDGSPAYIKYTNSQCSE